MKLKLAECCSTCLFSVFNISNYSGAKKQTGMCLYNCESKVIPEPNYTKILYDYAVEHNALMPYDEWVDKATRYLTSEYIELYYKQFEANFNWW